MADKLQEMVVTDIKIPFWSMVVLLVKWSFAAIPAVIVLVSVATILSIAVGTLFGYTLVWRDTV